MRAIDRRGARPRTPAVRLPSRNALLAVADALAVRTGWAGREREASWSLSARPSAVRAARRLATARLSAWGLHRQAETAELLVGELVSDALRRCDGRIRLELRVEDGLLRCEVSGVFAGPGARPGPAPHRSLLARLACCWGVCGQVAWFELPAGGGCVH
ncbi:ATP-binding protein [Nonomuraea sp. KC401]|uniref:ATP-binding protein n=1 Tax=Nonomuraea longispora TaxID=1848320 RepID=A0A4R4MJH6_9ACTN|nr:MULTISPECIES: ATP-binding protein [Nonomuraea]NBE99800.1 ATP-binding protein [Nonomuraea sp. K271]TDB94262.1 ATP-binding protein [Nonomuraea longispora]TLF49729.1 ATP-binding protein [Nonomuraea sp. KC401]